MRLGLGPAAALPAGRALPHHQKGDTGLASRSNTKFQKRQKELARAEKRQEKASRRELRRIEKGNAGKGPPVEPIDEADLGLGDQDSN